MRARHRSSQSQHFRLLMTLFLLILGLCLGDLSQEWLSELLIYLLHMDEVEHRNGLSKIMFSIVSLKVSAKLKKAVKIFYILKTSTHLSAQTLLGLFESV